MELRQLRSLVTISELGSISLAAERLCLSPPAIHKQLKILESDLGLPLYEKVGRRLQLTPPAVLLLPYFKDMLAQYDCAFSALQEWKGVKRGLLRIGTGPSVYVLPAILKEFRHAHPHIEVFVETGNTPVLLEDLTKGCLDLVLVVSPDLIEQQDYCVELTWDFEMVLVSHLRRPPRRPHLAQLKKSPFILFRKGSRMQEPIDRYFAKHAFNPKVSMRLDSSELIKRMVRAGFGIAMLPRWVVDSEIKDGSLTIVHQAEPQLYSKLALVRRKLGYVPRPVSAFVDTASALDGTRLRLLTLNKEGAVSSRTRAESP